MPKKDLFTVAEVAPELGVSPRRVRHLIEAGRLRAEKVLGVWIVGRSDLEKVRERRPGRPRKGSAAREHGHLSVYHRSQKQTWRTPAALYDKLNAEFRFTLDAAAEADNAKCGRFFTPEQDGLRQAWGRETVFCNPPYRDGARWMRKAYEAAGEGATVVLLVPARPGRSDWQRYVIPHAEVRFLPGRIKFEGALHSAPFDSAVVVFRPRV